MERRHLTVFVILSIFGGMLSMVAQDAADPTMDSIAFEIEVMRSEAHRPLNELNDKYDSALERLQAEEQQRGNLEGMISIQKERDTFRENPESNAHESGVEGLIKLRGIYEEQRATTLVGVTEKYGEILETYAEKLELLKIDLTKAGKIDEAMTVDDRIKAIEKRLAGMRAGQVAPTTGHRAIGAPDQEIVVGEGVIPAGGDQIEVEAVESGVILTSSKNDRRIWSDREFEVPFRIEARAATDSTNIRIEFGEKGILILNWELNWDELRLHEPLTGKKYGIKGAGRIEENRMHDIVVEVETDKIRVLVDRRTRYELKGDFSGSQGKIGIGPAFGSRVHVEKFVGIQESSDD